MCPGSGNTSQTQSDKGALGGRPSATGVKGLAVTVTLSGGTKPFPTRVSAGILHVFNVPGNIDPHYGNARPIVCPKAQYELLIAAEVGTTITFTNKAGFEFKLTKDGSL